jgi:beta-lactamase regulating signal transducer with metallopeptidase domain
MMDRIFLVVFNMSLTASFVIAVVILARLFLRRTPKIISYALWAVVLFNLLCPFKPESVFSLIPFNANPVSDDILVNDADITFLGAFLDSMRPPDDETIIMLNPDKIDIDSENNPYGKGVDARYLFGREAQMKLGSYIWPFGMAALLLYAVIGYIFLKRRVSLAVRVEGNVYETDRIDSPFVLGLFRPRIYIPTGLETALAAHIIEHERTHIRRRDYIVSVVAFAALALHWFNPLVWIAYTLMLRDMESSCDEAVLRKSDGDIRKEYSSALLGFSQNKRRLSFPLAFGEQGVKARV